MLKSELIEGKRYRVTIEVTYNGFWPRMFNAGFHEFVRKVKGKYDAIRFDKDQIKHAKIEEIDNE